MNRYEEILTRLVAARVANDHDPLITASSGKLREAARALEDHFLDRAAGNDYEHEHLDIPALLRRQAE